MAPLGWRSRPAAWRTNSRMAPWSRKTKKTQKITKNLRTIRIRSIRRIKKSKKTPKIRRTTKAHKDSKHQKDQKDIKDRKEHLKEPKEPVDLAAKAPAEASGGVEAGGSELDALIKRISGLEQTVAELKMGQ